MPSFYQFGIGHLPLRGSEGGEGGVKLPGMGLWLQMVMAGLQPPRLAYSKGNRKILKAIVIEFPGSRKFLKEIVNF